MRKEGKRKYYSLVLLIATLIIALPTLSNAAQIVLHTKSKAVSAGSIVRLDVRVEENKDPINAISGAIFIPFEHFDVASVSLDQSVISFWIKEPSYNKEAGLLEFEGIVLKEGGFRAEEGHIFSLVLNAVTTGQARIELVSGSILAHDGSATNVLSSLEGVNISVESRNDCVGIECVPESLRPLTISMAEEGDIVANAQKTSLTASGVLFSWIGTLVAFIGGAILAFIIENRMHPHTAPNSYRESAKDTQRLVNIRKNRVSKKALLYFSVPILVAFLTSIFVTYIIYITLDNADLLFIPIIKMPIFYFLVLLALHMILYVLVLWAIFRSLKRKFFGGVSYFWGTILGAVIILTILFSGFDQYRFIFEEGIASLPSASQIHLSTIQ